MERRKLEFTFEGQPVGYFEEPEFPASGGRYRYMPYRGPGHYRMGIKLSEAGRAQCSYDSGGERVLFIVQSCPEYGVLELGEYKRTPKAGD
jgi:hypothetical protein